MKSLILKNNLRKIVPIIISSAVAFLLGCSYTKVIANNTLQSQGKLIYNNPETNEEIIIDTNDFNLLQQEIEELKSSLEIERLCGTTETSNARIYKKGTQVYIEIGTYSSYENLERMLSRVLPEHARPTEAVRIPATIAFDNSSTNFYYYGELIIETDGTMKASYTNGDRLASATTGYIMCNGSFTVE